MSEKLKVVVYCRVSTNQDSQNLSYDSQKAFYEEYVNNNPDWELVNIYAERTSGTNVNRPEFKKMMLEAGIQIIQNEEEFIVRDLKTKSAFDLIIVKDEKRFSRTMDITPILSALRKKGIGVFFENINKSTLDVEDILTINMLLSVADNFSKSLSKNLKTSINKNQRLNPHYSLSHNVPLGFTYKKEDDRTLLFPIDEKTKNDFKRMFELYAYEGYGFRRCATFLTEQGYRTPTGLNIQGMSVERILRNPCYMGCIRIYNHNQLTLQNMGHKRAKNLPEDMVDFVKCEDITPMIDEDLWYKAYNTLKGKDLKNRRGVKTVQTTYSKILRCNCCGNIFVKYSKNGQQIYICKSKKADHSMQPKKIKCRNAYLDVDYIDEYFDNQVKDKTFINDFKAKINGYIEYITFYKYALIETFFQKRDYDLISSLNKQIEEIRKQQDEFVDKFQTLPEEVITRKILRFQDEIKEIQKKLDSAEFSYDDFEEDLGRISYLLNYLSSRKINKVSTREELFPLIDEVLVTPDYPEEKKPIRNKVTFKLFSKAETEVEIEIFSVLEQMKIILNSEYNDRWVNRKFFSEDDMKALDDKLKGLV